MIYMIIFIYKIIFNLITLKGSVPPNVCTHSKYIKYIE